VRDLSPRLVLSSLSSPWTMLRRSRRRGVRGRRGSAPCSELTLRAEEEQEDTRPSVSHSVCADRCASRAAYIVSIYRHGLSRLYTYLYLMCICIIMIGSNGATANVAHPRDVQQPASRKQKQYTCRDRRSRENRAAARGGTRVAIVRAQLRGRNGPYRSHIATMEDEKYCDSRGRANHLHQTSIFCCPLLGSPRLLS
jgi:hypothetical protein